MNGRLITILGGLGLAILTGCYYDVQRNLYGEPVDCTEATTSYAGYALDIAPLISTACMGCHSAPNPAGGLSLETYAERAEAADLMRTLMNLPSSDPNAMPPGAPLHRCDLEVFELWMQNGKLND